MHRPIIWQLAGGGGQLADRHGGKKGRLLALEFGVDAVAAISSQSRVGIESLAGLAQSRGIDTFGYRLRFGFCERYKEEEPRLDSQTSIAMHS